MKTTPKATLRKLPALYARMEREYAQAAAELGLSCQGCSDNCCVSFFQHHTYVEWAYLWEGMDALPGERREDYLRRAGEYVRLSREALAAGQRPKLMCPVNDGGLCGLYSHRLMICRLHGVPNVLRRPDGRPVFSPGCWKAQELCADRQPQAMDRTDIYTALARLEMDFLGARMRALPRVDLTLAEMLVMGPPRLRPEA